MEWQGIWSDSSILKDCDSGEIFWSSTSLDTVCPGDTYDIEFEENPLDCTGTVSGDEFHWECEGEVETGIPDCTAHVTTIVDGTRNGDTYEETVETWMEFQGVSCIMEDLHTCMEITGSRIAPAGTGCP